jgi:hypothetical protein
MSEPTLQDRRRLHECAHAIVSELLGLKVHEVFAKRLGAGCVHQVRGDVDDAAEAEKVLIVCLAGAEAERQVCPSLWGLESVPGCSTDDQDASDMAARLARLHGVSRSEALREGERKARHLVEENWPQIVALAGSLSWAHDRLTGPALTEALEAAALGCRSGRPEYGQPRLPAAWQAVAAITFTEDQIERMITGDGKYKGRHFASALEYSLWAGPLKGFWRAATTGPSMAANIDPALFGTVRAAVRAELRAAAEEAVHA